MACVDEIQVPSQLSNTDCLCSAEWINCQGLGISCPEEIFEASFFHEDPRPFYKFARKLYFPLGNDKKVLPSDSHRLLALLDQKKMLRRCYSQNIDGLEEVAGVTPNKIICVT